MGRGGQAQVSGGFGLKTGSMLDIFNRKLEGRARAVGKAEGLEIKRPFEEEKEARY
jgi:hypothetical protein